MTDQNEWSNRARQLRAAQRRERAEKETAGLELWGASRPLDNGTATSRAAAEAIWPHVRGIKRAVLDEIHKAPEGLTRLELVERTGLKENTVNGRCAELLRAGLVVEVGTRNGRKILLTSARAWAA